MAEETPDTKQTRRKGGLVVDIDDRCRWEVSWLRHGRLDVRLAPARGKADPLPRILAAGAQVGFAFEPVDIKVQRPAAHLEKVHDGTFVHVTLETGVGRRRTVVECDRVIACLREYVSDGIYVALTERGELLGRPEAKAGGWGVHG